MEAEAVEVLRTARIRLGEGATGQAASTRAPVQILDTFEDEVPANAYRHVQVTVIKEDGEKELVTTHIAAPIGKFKPKEHYLEWVVKGVTHWKLPDECLDAWKSYTPR